MNVSFVSHQGVCLHWLRNLTVFLFTLLQLTTIIFCSIFLVLGPDHKERITQVKQVVRPELVKFVKHCIDHCKFPSENIMLFGFSQGAQIALDLAAFGGFQLRGVVSIAGYMMEESENDEPALAKTKTKVLVMQGDKDDMRTVKEAKEKVKHLERLFGKANIQQLIVDGMGHGMPNSEVKKKRLKSNYFSGLFSRIVLTASLLCYSVSLFDVGWMETIDGILCS